jgi:arsenite methyltransferase
MSTSFNPDDPQNVREKVRAGYAEVARSGASSRVESRSSCCSSSACCGAPPGGAEQLAQSVGYDADELANLPEGANMGLSCGNPTALAALQPGEVVLDLGSGGGLDCFLAGPRVGPTGRVIGVDMTPEMLSKARTNLVTYRERTSLDNVEFRLGEIEHLPVPDNSIDVVISNCVINLSPDKPQVWREIARVLKPGGRVAVSDLALLQPLPQQVREMVEALVGCVAGAMLITDTRRYVAEAGLVDIDIEQKPQYVEAMAVSGDPLYQQITAALPAGTRPADFVTSMNLSARKPE